MTVGCVDALVVAYHSADWIAALVEDLAARPEVATVIVVDHGDDGSAELARAAGAMVMDDPTNPGFGAGMNHAAALGSSPFLLLMNPDAELAPGAIAAGVSALEGDSDIGAVQGTITTSSTGELERAGGAEPRAVDLLGRASGAKALLRWTPVASLVSRIPALSHQVERGTAAALDVETLAGTAPLIRREAFESIGGFDESYFLYGEDLDLCRRLRANRWRLVYLPVEWATHENGSSSSSWWDRELRWWEGTMRFVTQYWSGWQLRLGRLAAALMCARLAIANPRRTRVAWNALTRSAT